MSNHHDNDELKHLLNRYDFENAYLTCFGIDKNFAKSIIKNLTNFAKRYHKSGPDLLSDNDKQLIGVEHFEYDSSCKNRRGSAEKREIERINSTFRKEAHEAASLGRDLFKTYNINARADENTLKNNFLKTFSKHESKIDIYKSNIRNEKNTKPSIWFLAEDVSIMGPMFHSNCIIDGHPEIALLPIFYSDVQRCLLQSKVDGIIFISSFPISNFMVFIKNRKASYKQLVEYYRFHKDVPVQFFNDSSYGCSSFCALKIEQ